jgi:hypothetical protein
MAGLLSVFLFAQPLYASFEPLPVGGRAAGMGEAYSAIVDDVFSLYYNPAGVLQVNRPEVGTYYSKLYSGLTDNSNVNRMFFGYAQPFGKGGKMGGIGASYMALNLSGLYKEEALGLTYGQEFHHLWNVAGTLKILKKQIGSDPYSSNAIDPVTGVATGSADPLLAKSKSSSAMGLDLGMQYRLTQAYALGFAARNINSPDLAIGTQKDAAPAVYTFALARKMRNGSLDLEIMNWKATDNNMRFSLGGEHWFKSGLGLRAGGGFGSRNYSAASFGASYKMESIQFDYATVLPLQGIQGTMGIQQISFVLRLGEGLPRRKVGVDAGEVGLRRWIAPEILVQAVPEYAGYRTGRRAPEGTAARPGGERGSDRGVIGCVIHTKPPVAVHRPAEDRPVKPGARVDDH